MKRLRFTPILLLAAACAVGAGWWLQHAQYRVLQSERALLQSDVDQLAALRAENARLKAAQPTAAELSTLQADSAAVQRLRHELASLRDSIQRSEAAVGQPADNKSSAAQ